MTAPIVAAAATVPTRIPVPSLEVRIARKETAPRKALKGNRWTGRKLGVLREPSCWRGT